MLFRPAVAAALLVLAGLPALAQGTSAERAACTPDVFRLCASDIPDVDAIVVCLKRERPKLSGGCRAVMDASDKKVQTAGTRSLNATAGWCHFGGTEASDDDWRTWCDSSGSPAK